MRPLSHGVQCVIKREFFAFLTYSVKFTREYIHLGTQYIQDIHFYYGVSNFKHIFYYCRIRHCVGPEP
jgi:hypothetical protein